MVLGTLNYMAPDYIITGEVLQLDAARRSDHLPDGDRSALVSRSFVKTRQPAPQGPGSGVESLCRLGDLLAGMLHWDPAARPTCRGSSATAILADELRGPGLRRYAEEVVPKILSGRGPPRHRAHPRKDHQRRCIPLPDPIQDPSGADPEPVEPAPVPVPTTEGRADTDDAPTQIAPRVAMLESLEPHTAEVASSPVPTPSVVNDRAWEAETVTVEPSPSPTSPPPSSSATASPSSAAY